MLELDEPEALVVVLALVLTAAVHASAVSLPPRVQLGLLALAAFAVLLVALHRGGVL